MPANQIFNRYPNNFIIATGGTITYDGLYKIHTFWDADTFVVTNAPAGVTMEVLLIGGGGGGGGFGGGGAGQYIYNAAYPIAVGAYPVTIGSGGAGSTQASAKGSNGSSSTFDSLTAIGGGGGGAFDDTNLNGANGASGGGGGTRSNSPFTAGTGGTGTAGHNGGAGDPTGNAAAGGGGGSSAENGHNAQAGFVGGAGGDGTLSSISGVPIYRAAGGGGSGGTTRGLGGLGGGGNGGQFNTIVPTNGEDFTGSGGGGSYASTNAGSGGKGVLIIRYQYRFSLLATIGKMIENAFTISNYTKTGSFTVVHNPTSMVFTGGNGTYSNFVYCNAYVSGANNFTLTNYVTVGTVNGTSFGSFFGFVTNGPAFTANRGFMSCDTTNGANQGKSRLAVYDGGGSETLYTSSAGFLIQSGNELKQTLTVEIDAVTKQRIITATALNMTLGGSSTVSLSVSYNFPVTIELNNTFKAAFGQLGGTNTVTAWDLTVNEQRGVDILVITDSKGDGFCATDMSFAWPVLAAATGNKTYALSGGPSGRPSMAKETLLELKQHTATVAFIFNGCNQVRSSPVDPALIAPCVVDIGIIKTFLDNLGVTTYVMSSAPENAFDFTAFNTALSVAFGLDYIDDFTALKDGGTGLNPAYDCGDGTHENNAGNAVIQGIVQPFV